MNLIRKQNTWYPSIMDDFFNTNWNFDIPTYSNSLPAVNVKEADKEFLLQIASPGLTKEDFEVSFEDNVLSIEVLKKDDVKANNNDFSRFEFDYNSFKRSFTIPESVEILKIEASYLNGVLNINLPKKKEAHPLPKKLIKIK
jgi:HSP20 family protein